MDLIIRVAEERDKTSIISLLNAEFSDIQRTAKQRGEEYWNWKFRDNPFGESILTVTETDNRLIAVNNLWPWELSIRGSVIKALQPCDSVVQADWRGKGFFKKMRIHGVEIAREQGVSLLFNFPNENSIKAYLSLGWHFQGKISWRVKVLNPVKVILGSLSSGKTESVKIDDEYSIDTEILDILASKNAAYDGFLKINRIPGFHEWRYTRHPYRSYGMVHYEQGSKSAAAVFTINQNGRNREMVIVDFLGSKDNIIGVVKMVEDAGRKMGAGFLAIMDNPAIGTSVLWERSFFRRELKNMVVLPLNLNMESIVKGFSNWSLMAGMHDSI